MRESRSLPSVLALQSLKISFLWSKDFVALCKVECGTWLKKVLFISAILLCLVLSVIVGPASATAMMPLDKEWEASALNYG